MKRTGQLAQDVIRSFTNGVLRPGKWAPRVLLVIVIALLLLIAIMSGL